MKTYRSLPVIGFIIITIFFSSCTFVSDYDNTSYRHLTDLKAEMKVAFEGFSVDGAKGDKDKAILDQFKKYSAQGYEYEKGKPHNDDTMAQWQIIDSMTSELLQRFKQDGKNELSPGYCKAKWMNLETAFDIAISTEGSKLKN